MLKILCLPLGKSEAKKFRHHQNQLSEADCVPREGHHFSSVLKEAGLSPSQGNKKKYSSTEFFLTSGKQKRNDSERDTEVKPS